MKEVTGIRRTLARAAVEIGIFSVVINVLQLVTPVYLLQVYDRVLPSASTETLTYITIVMIGALIVLGLLEAVRSFYGYRLTARLITKIGGPAVVTSLLMPGSQMGEIRPVQDLQAIKSAVESRSLFALFDLPFVPLFAVILYAIHPGLFLMALAGVVLLIVVTILNQVATASASKGSAEQTVAANTMAQTYARNAETLMALGMVRNAVEHWGKTYGAALEKSDAVARTNTIYSAISRSARMILQSAILGLGAYYVILGEMTGGMIFASSIIAGRIFQPFDQVIGSWRLIAESWRAAKRLRTTVEVGNKISSDRFELPEPKGEIIVESLVYRLPGGKPGAMPLIKNITFGVRPGQVVAVVGPSKAGKSTLARLIVGAVKPASGSIRIDGADIASWKFDELGSHVGYLAQDVELFPGTIAQNIARFDPDATDEKIMAASRRAQVEDLILSLENNYDTIIGGASGVRLSGGERQRIALARAFYGNPKLIVLDEPNSSLDADGETALARAIFGAKDEKTTVLLITHRLSIAQQCDLVLALRDGAIDKYGPSQAVLAALRGQKPQTVQQMPQPAATGTDGASAEKPTAEGRPVTGSFMPMSIVTNNTKN